MRRPVVVLLVVLLALSAGTLSRPAPARAQTTFSNTAPITIPDVGAASLYPSPIAVSGLSGVITDVDVTLTGLSHTHPPNLDILLVGPTGQTALLWTDFGGNVGGDDIVNATITFDDAGPPAPFAVVSGTYRPSFVFWFASFPTLAPAPPYGGILAGFNGSDPNGTWRLFVADAQAQDSGAISGGWSLTLTTAPAPAGAVTTTLSNPAALPIADDGTASSYPSTITASGLLGTIVDVEVTLTGLSHALPSDLDLLLVGPGEQHVMLLSDIGQVPGDNSVSNLTLTFDDQATAAALAPPLVAGTFQPTNLPDQGFVDPLPALAPAGPHGTNLSVFSGTDPNGTWSLFIVDDRAEYTGTLAGGWILTLTTADTTAPTVTVPATITVLASSPAGAVVTYSASATDAIDGDVPVTCAPPSGSTFPLGTTMVTCTATDAAGNVGTATFQVMVGGPVLSQLRPNRVALSSTAQTFTIRGANFVAGATVTVGQRTYAATVVSSTELRVSLVPKDVFVYGWLVMPSAPVRVTNPGGATSNSLTLWLRL
jgi:subtilisin-like proprotein convertase family protein